VNSPTIRYSTPAAAPRTGRGESALPPTGLGTKTQFLPFAALPHDLRKDPQLKGNRTAIVLAAALLEYARSKPACWPSNARLAEDLGVLPANHSQCPGRSGGGWLGQGDAGGGSAQWAPDPTLLAYIHPTTTLDPTTSVRPPQTGWTPPPIRWTPPPTGWGRI
jgi:hypothetical protein